MKDRRSIMMALAVGLVALAVVVAPAIAEELFGVITNVNVEDMKLTVLSKEDDSETIITTNEDTELVTQKGANKVTKKSLEGLNKFVTKVKDAGKKGIPARITHENKVASKITVLAKKKAAPKEEK
jgi:hypothetical protein